MGENSGYKEYKGCIHIHAGKFRNGKSLMDISEAAKKSDIDFVGITEHHTCNYKENGWKNGVLFLIGQEIGSHRDQHCLALSIKREVGIPEIGSYHYLEEIRKEGGLTFIAHPHEKGNPRYFITVNPWKNWEDAGFSGIELWSYMHDWISKATYSNFLDLFMNPDKAISGPNPKTIRKWDEITRKKRVVAIGGLDCHFTRRGFKKYRTLLSYEYIFRTIRTHILTQKEFKKEFNHDSEIVYEALREGNCFLSYDYLADATGFRFEGSFKGEKLILGNQIYKSGHERICLNASSPVKCLLILLKDGNRIKSFEGSELSYITSDPGVYRVEAYYKERPWVFTNPIYVREQQE